MSTHLDQPNPAAISSAAKDMLKVDIDGADETLQVLENYQSQLGVPLSPEDDRRLLRKIDLCLIPLLFFSYLFQYLDKQAMNYSAILGLQTDMHLVGQDYSWAVSLFYFGYLAASGIVALLIIRLPVGRFMSAAMGVWSAILMLTVLCESASALWAARFFLGSVEASIAPSMSLIIPMWYKRSEQPIRQASWFMGNVLGGLVGGLLGYAVGHIHGFAAWKALFIIFGSTTFVWSIICYFALPDSPMGAWFLQEEDQIKAVERIQDNLTGIKSHRIKRYQVIEALVDPKTWLFALFQFTQNVPNGGVGSFASIVVEGFGFTTLDTLLVQMIGTGFQVVFVTISALGSTYLKNTRTYWMTFNTIMALIGTVMIRQINPEQIWARFMGYCLIIAFSANFPLTMTMITSNTAGFTKKSTVTAVVFVAYCAGNIVGPQIMFAREAPSYPSGFAGMLVCFSVSAIISLLIRFYCIWENRKRDAAAAAVNLEQDGVPVSWAAFNLTDKTDRELHQFRYVY
ncbi:Major facilitator superfamily domain general substrate transporter [Penicillium riverlandense]|uniref:Major facilitator superfamily domain general substrate transporter n=1 Tax=Penicillium riverlandense TaxID=1903569 RepID=UPI002546FE44|nr:Major facilitator superfamily domain general substrate transporter [Penicillium riverlandense]KAJ5825294.1 Major facilitator superfamily domain general substrate transporter [Penicillium riverlandense]